MSAIVARLSPLNDLHLHWGGKLVDFHGWMLPVQYTSVIDEHHAVRQKAGVFDISHMGQIQISGPNALAYLQHLTTSDLRRGVEKGIGVYAHLLLPTGGVIDDIFIYPRSAQELFVVVNSATHEKDLAWMVKHATPGVTITDLENRAALAIQGPEALRIIKSTIAGVAELPRFAFQRVGGGDDAHEALWACRTGYTGEPGAEFFGPAGTIRTLWKQFFENAGDALKPCGLGARDTLRLEVGYPLYGNELGEDRTPLEARMGWVVNWHKGDFIGRDALEKQKAGGLKEALLAYELTGRGVPRQGAAIYKEGVAGGQTTSGTFSPSLQKGIGLAYAPAGWNVPGAALDVEIRGQRFPARVTPLPFYKKPA